MAMEAPAFSLDYFPSKEVAWSLYQERKLVNGSSTPLGSHGRKSISHWDYFNTGQGTYGSVGSSNGPWAGDVLPSEPLTPYSTGNTPPSHSRLAQSNPTASLSTSPDASQRTTRRSTSNLSTAFASLSRPFSITASSSPDDRQRLDSELSTSAPSGITWGVNTVFSGGGTPSPEKRRRSSLRRLPSVTIDSAYDSEGSDDRSESEREPSTPLRAVSSGRTSPTIHLKLKNQHLFDDEASASAPLLDPRQTEKYVGYRELYADQLSVWGLPIPRAEILKFNGLISYWALDHYEHEQASALPPLTPLRQFQARQSLITMATAPEKVLPFDSCTIIFLSNCRQISTAHNDLDGPYVTVETPGGGKSTNGSMSLLELAAENKRIYKLNPAAQPFTPGVIRSTVATPKSLLPVDRYTSAAATGDETSNDGFNAPTEKGGHILQRAQGSVLYPAHQSCTFCWQPTDGLFFYTCSSRMHVAHASCLARFERSVGRNPMIYAGPMCDCPGYPPYGDLRARDSDQTLVGRDQ